MGTKITIGALKLKFSVIQCQWLKENYLQVMKIDREEDTCFYFRFVYIFMSHSANKAIYHTQQAKQLSKVGRITVASVFKNLPRHGPEYSQIGKVFTASSIEPTIALCLDTTKGFAVSKTSAVLISTSIAFQNNFLEQPLFPKAQYYNSQKSVDTIGK